MYSVSSEMHFVCPASKDQPLPFPQSMSSSSVESDRTKFGRSESGTRPEPRPQDLPPRHTDLRGQHSTRHSTLHVSTPSTETGQYSNVYQTTPPAEVGPPPQLPPTQQHKLPHSTSTQPNHRMIGHQQRESKKH